jgi:hypothetical protein
MGEMDVVPAAIGAGIANMAADVGMIAETHAMMIGASQRITLASDIDTATLIGTMPGEANVEAGTIPR